MRRSAIDTLININWSQLRLAASFCPLCNKQRIFVRLANNEIGIRCLSCRATSVTLSLVDVLLDISPSLKSKVVYELSCRGALFKFLRRRGKLVSCSEYFNDVASGAYKDAVQCQDVQKLTYPDESFDICTSTEVFEHVPNDLKGFSEICRVLKPTGVFIFTVPIDLNNITIERAALLPGDVIQHLLPAEYHGDPVRSNNRILAYRNYGIDILDRLTRAGFNKSEIRSPRHAMPWGYSRPIIVAYREHAALAEVAR